MFRARIVRFYSLLLVGVTLVLGVPFLACAAGGAATTSTPTPDVPTPTPTSTVSALDFTGYWKNVEQKPHTWAVVNVSLQGNTINVFFYEDCTAAGTSGICPGGSWTAPFTGNPVQMTFPRSTGLSYDLTFLLSGSALRVTTVMHTPFGDTTTQDLFRK